jgi:hypothetical protein
MAAEHGVGGRVVSDEEEEIGSLARIEGHSAFGKAVSLTSAEIMKWLAAISESQPDIILLDYGYEMPLPLAEGTPEHLMLRNLSDQSLLIAAGGNQTVPPTRRHRVMVTAPAAYKEVLSVGCLRNDGQLQPYAEWTPGIVKPDIFIADQLLATPLEEALTPNAIMEIGQGPYGPGTHGSSFAALHAVAAAILVWSTVPECSPDAVRNMLRMAARPVKTSTRPMPLALNVIDAVAAARRHLVMDTLSEGPCSMQALAAITGLELRFVSENLDHLVEAGKVRRLPRGRLERYEAIREG